MFGGLLGLGWFLLSQNVCTIMVIDGPLQTCKCKGYELITQNSLESRGNKTSLCVGYISQSYDLINKNYFPSKLECELAFHQICEYKSCKLSKDRVLPKYCKFPGEGWTPIDYFR